MAEGAAEGAGGLALESDTEVHAVRHMRLKKSEDDDDDDDNNCCCTRKRVSPSSDK